MASNQLSKNIARCRKQIGMTQEDLGQALFVSGQAVSRWERGGTPDAELLPKIADALGVSLDVLFGREAEDRRLLRRRAGQILFPRHDGQRKHGPAQRRGSAAGPGQQLL